MAHDKYTRRQKYISTDGGLTFNPVTPPEYIKGELIETESVDCGAEVITWVPVEDVYICENVGGVQPKEKTPISNPLHILDNIDYCNMTCGELANYMITEYDFQDLTNDASFFEKPHSFKANSTYRFAKDPCLSGSCFYIEFTTKNAVTTTEGFKGLKSLSRLCYFILSPEFAGSFLDEDLSADETYYFNSSLYNTFAATTNSCHINRLCCDENCEPSIANQGLTRKGLLEFKNNVDYYIEGEWFIPLIEYYSNQGYLILETNTRVPLNQYYKVEDYLTAKKPLIAASLKTGTLNDTLRSLWVQQSTHSFQGYMINYN